MPPLVLVTHPTTPQPLIRTFEVHVARVSARSLLLRYEIEGALEQLSIPSFQQLERADRLWEHTCFELFLQVPGESRYLEFNFAPSGAFAAYSFDGYRAGMQPVAVAPSIKAERKAEHYGLNVTFETELPERPLHAAISAVIEAADGERSYWALTHAPGKPDFHHPNVFIHTLDGVPQ